MSVEPQSLKSTCLPGYSILLAMHATRRNFIYLRYHGMAVSYVHLRFKIDNWIKMQYIRCAQELFSAELSHRFIHAVCVCAVRTGKDPVPRISLTMPRTGRSS